MARTYRTTLADTPRPPHRIRLDTFNSRHIEPACFDTDWDDSYVQTTPEDAAQFVRFVK
jgi:hypothetical protein